MPSRNVRDMVLLFGLFIVLGTLIALGPGRNREEPATSSSFSSSNIGAMALYRWAGRLGFNAQQLAYQPFAVSEADAALVLLNPGEPIGQQEADDVLDWVDGGGTLILADERSVLLGEPNRFFEELSFRTIPLTRTADLVRARPDAVLGGGEVDIAAQRGLITDRTDYAPLLRSEDGVLLLAGVPRGRGYIYIGSTAGLFTNAGLRDPARARLALHVLSSLPPGGRIVFDEIHHGYVTPPSEAQGVLGTPWGWAGVYAALVVFGYLALSGRRFGRPVPLPANTARRSSAEYVESLADLYQRAGQRQAIQQYYHAQLKRRVAKPYGVSAQLDDAAFVADVERARGKPFPELAPLLAALSRANPSESDLLAAAAASTQLVIET